MLHRKDERTRTRQRRIHLLPHNHLLHLAWLQTQSALHDLDHLPFRLRYQFAPFLGRAFGSERVHVPDGNKDRQSVLSFWCRRGVAVGEPSGQYS